MQASFTLLIDLLEFDMGDDKYFFIWTFGL